MAALEVRRVSRAMLVAPPPVAAAPIDLPRLQLRAGYGNSTSISAAATGLSHDRHSSITRSKSSPAHRLPVLWCQVACELSVATGESAKLVAPEAARLRKPAQWSMARRVAAALLSVVIQLFAGDPGA